MVNTTLDIVVNLQVEAAKKQLQQLNQIVGFMNSQMAKTITPGQEVRQLSNDLANMLKTQDQMAAISGKNNANYKAATEEVKRLQKELGLSTAQTEKLRQKTKAFSFDFLTLLFAGMMLQKTFGGMFKSIIDGYKKTVGLNSQFNRSALKLQANFEFLKFSIANALNSPFVINAIEWFTDRINQLSDFFLDHPGFAKAILAVVAALATIGTLSMIASGVKQIGMLMGIMGLSSTATAIENLGKLAGIGAIILSIKFGWDAAKDLINGNIDIRTIIRGAFAGFLARFGITLLKGGTLGTALVGGLILGTIIAGLLIGIKFILDANKTIDESKKEAAYSWARLKGLIKGTLQALIGSQIPLTAIGAAVGGPPGAGVGFLIGTVLAGIGVSIKMLMNPKVDTSELQGAGGGEGAGARAVDEAFKDLESQYQTQTTEVNPEIEAYREKIKEVEAIDLFKGIDMEKFNSFKQTLSDIKEPLASFNLGLSGEKGFYVTLFSINELLGTTLLNYMDNMNTYLSNGVSLTTSYNGVLTTQITNMDRLAKSTNNAAAAQERLNKAKEKAGGVVKKVYDAITGKSTTTG